MKTFSLYFLVLAGILGIFLFAASPRALAATNISSATGQHWAWNDEIGWIDFNAGESGNVNVTPTQLEGYASSTVGSISLNCDATNPSGVSVCGASNYAVANDGGGNLSGWAWNDEIGWISFFWGNASANPSAPLTSLCSSYESLGYAPTCGVAVKSGVFSGWAWNDEIGWIDFSCGNPETPSLCSGSSFEVATTWVPQAATGTLDSQIFDTGVASGAQLNSVTWKGSLNGLSGSAVVFQFAVSSSTSGPWNYVGCDGTSASYFNGTGCANGNGPGTPIPLGNYSLTGRYFRYRITLTTDVAQKITPRVDDVIVNWSP
jgi:hypothetical protein